MFKARRSVVRLLSLALAGSLCFALPAAAKDRLLVFAAASLTESLNAAADAYAAAGHDRPVISFAASSILAKQIENGAPAGLYLSADENWADYLEQRGLLVAGSRTSFLGNSLVLVAPAAQPLSLKIHHGFGLLAALGGGKLAMGDPDSVPAGIYGKAALTNLGVWDQVSASVVRGDSVRTALRFVETGAARAGIVYATDAKISQKVVVVDTFPEVSHAPITYPLAQIKGHDSPDARDFYAWLQSSQARTIFTRFGFSVK